MIGMAGHGLPVPCCTGGMFAPLTTDRLVIRRVELDDIDDLAARRGHPDVARYQGWTLPYSRERAERWVAESTAVAGFVEDRWWPTVVVERATGEAVGDLVVRSEWGGRAAEIGYTLTPAHWGRGFATEAVEAMVAHLVDDLGMTRVHATLHPDNVASARVLERAGFAYEGTTRNSYWVGEENSDDWCYGLTPDHLRQWRDRATEPPDEVALVAVTPDNARAVLRLRTHHSQEAFVAPNVYSFADALVPEIIDGAPVVPWMRAVEADGELVGFVMLAEVTEHHPEPYLWRLLVDRLHQRRGIGARALAHVEQRCRDLGATSLLTSWVDGAGSPRPFYEGRGYVPTGDLVDGEVEARLLL